MNGIIVDDDGTIRSYDYPLNNTINYPYLYFSYKGINYVCFYNIRKPSLFDLKSGNLNKLILHLTNTKVYGSVIIYRIKNISIDINNLISPSRDEILNMSSIINYCNIL